MKSHKPNSPWGRISPNVRLNTRIAELGFTNKTLAKEASVSASTISYMRNRRYKQCQVVILAVAKALNSTPSELDLIHGEETK